MAHTLFDIFPVLDNQTTISVQSLLESPPESSVKNGSLQTDEECVFDCAESRVLQTDTRHIDNGRLAVSLDVNLDDDDVLQCGKCKKQFSSLVSFISHKREPCRSDQIVDDVVASSDDVERSTSSVAANVLFEGDVCAITSSVAGHMTPAIQDGSTPTGSVATPSLSQLTHSVVLNEAEFLSLTGIEPMSLSRSYTMHGSTVEQIDLCISPPFSQQTQLTSLSTAGATLSPTRFSNQTVFTMAPMKGSPTSLFAKTFTPICATDLDRCQTQLGCPSKGATTLSLGSNALISIGDGGISSAEMKDIGNTVTYSIVAELQPISEEDLGSLGGVEAQEDGNEITSAIEKALNEPSSPKAKKRSAGKGNAKSDAAGKKAIKLQCIYCEKGFTKNFDLQQHIRSHTGEKPFQCIVCGRAFAQKSNVKKHMQTHKVWPGGLSRTLPNQQTQSLDETVSPTSCADPDDPIYEKCEEAVSTSSTKRKKSDLKKTVDDAQLKVVIDSSYVCQYCNEVFQTYCRLKTHLKTHKNEQVYKCIMRECGQTFHELDTFLDHTKTHENEMVYRCHVCNKTFPSLYDLGIHQYTHNGFPNQTAKPGSRCYRCTKCLNKYATPEALDHHMTTTTHSYSCPLCDKVFACERYLRRHLPTHGSAGLHSCPECHKHFKTEHYLKMHRLIHSGEKPFGCTECQASFNRKDKLKRHLLIHNPVKHYKCPFRSYTGCNKEFHRPDKLKAHILTHSGLRPYKCPHCVRTFSRPSHLREHQLLHNDSQFYCLDCNKRFTSDNTLLNHVCGGIATVKENRKRAKLKMTKRERATKKFCGSLVGENEKVAEQKSSVGESKRVQRLQRRALLNSVSSEKQQLVRKKKNVDHLNSETCLESNNLVEEDQLVRRNNDLSADLPEVHVTADDLPESDDSHHVMDECGQQETRLSANRDSNEMTVDDMNTLEKVLQPLVAVDPIRSLDEDETDESDLKVNLLPCDELLSCRPVIVAITTDDDCDHLSLKDEINS